MSTGGIEKDQGRVAAAGNVTYQLALALVHPERILVRRLALLRPAVHLRAVYVLGAALLQIHQRRQKRPSRIAMRPNHVARPAQEQPRIPDFQRESRLTPRAERGPVGCEEFVECRAEFLGQRRNQCFFDDGGDEDVPDLPAIRRGEREWHLEFLTRPVVRVRLEKYLRRQRPDHLVVKMLG